MRIIAIGDVGVVNSMMHIGDEAMFEQFLDQARARGVDDVLAISSNPAETAGRYGVGALPRFGLSGSREAMIKRARAIVAGDIAPDDPARETIEAVTSADRVVVTGAGNLASTWPVHIIDKWVLAQLAARAGIPFVVTGQTLGPELSSDDSALLAEVLNSAALVGVREAASFTLADRLGITATQTVDDASFLAIDRPTPSDRAPYCAVSLSTHVGVADRDAFVAAVARCLDSISHTTGLEIVFFAHFAPLDGEPRRGDIRMHEDVAALMTAPHRVEPTTDSTAAAWFARHASLVVSSRYHPAVFAVAGGVPTLGIAVDEYTTVKLTGALSNFGQDAVVSAAQLINDGVDAAIGELWRSRDAIRARSLEIAASQVEKSTLWWDRVVGA